MKLTEILNSDNIDLVLVDTSIQDDDNFGWDIYESTKYSSLDVESLTKEIAVVMQVKGVLENPKTRTIKAVTKEFRSFEQVINNKIKAFSEGYLPKNKKIKIKIKKRDNEPRYKLELLQEEAYETRMLSQAKELKVEDNNYELLLNMIKLIEPVIKIKRDMGFVYGFHEKDRARTSDTDERLTAALYWLSLFSGKSSCLITKDQDFASLSSIIPGLIGSGYFLPYNEFFRKRIIENPFRIYKKDREINGEFKLAIDSSLTHYNRWFSVKNASTRKNWLIKDDIARMWREFNPSIGHEYQTALVSQYA
ncbi:MAG: hypothetical protein Q8N63_07645 [Nanoarchaeota archaeon]|nr:hypothetical protein [Nanoarchaeota archaeon]